LAIPVRERVCGDHTPLNPAIGVAITEYAKEAAHNQQTAFQPSGKRNEPPGKLVCRWQLSATMERRRVGQEVLLRRGSRWPVRTASSKHSYSTSLITLSGYQRRTISKYFCVQIEVIDQIVSNFSSVAHLVTAVFIPEEE